MRTTYKYIRKEIQTGNKTIVFYEVGYNREGWIMIRTFYKEQEAIEYISKLIGNKYKGNIYD